jgi:hypothetical protein
LKSLPSLSPSRYGKIMRRFLHVSLLLVCLPLTSCIPFPDGVACTAIYVYGLSATVTDALTGASIDNATVTITDGAYQETMESFPGGGFVGAGERAGTYTLTASAPGFQTKIQDNIVVTGDVCHVHGVHVDVMLQPTP